MYICICAYMHKKYLLKKHYKQEVKMYAKQKVINIVRQLPDSMNFGEILNVLGTLYFQKYALVDKDDPLEAEKKNEKPEKGLVLEEI